MSCCGGNCGCGPDCKCGSACGGCKMYGDLSSTEIAHAPTVALVSGVAPNNTHIEIGVATENKGCKCGPDCKCDPCDCK